MSDKEISFKALMLSEYRRQDITSKTFVFVHHWFSGRRDLD